MDNSSSQDQCRDRQGITRQLAEAAPHAQVRVIKVPPMVGASLHGLDHVNAPPAAESRLRAAYGLPHR